MALAPSEKHLEDWIVTYPRFFGVSDDIGRFTPLIDQILFRQFRLPSGIPDILGAHGPYMRVLELKREVITADAVVQVMKYMEDLQHIWHVTESALHYSRQRELYSKAYPYSYLRDYRLRGILVGHSIKDEAINLACAAMNIQLIRYEYSYETNFYEFIHEQTGGSYEDMLYCDEIAKGPIGQAIANLIRMSHLETEAKA